MHRSPAVRRYFRRSAVLERLRRTPLPDPLSPADVGAWLQLLAAGCLLGKPNKALPTSRVDAAAVLAALDACAPDPSAPAIQHIQAQLWLGLREWVRVSGAPLQLPPALAATILAQFAAAEPPLPRQRKLNSLMIDWLERCKAEEWRAVVEQASLFEAVATLPAQGPDELVPDAGAP